MLPKPRAGWIISLTFEDVDGRGYVAPADQWKGIDEFVLDHNSAPEDVEAGSRRRVQTNKIEDRYCRCQNYKQGRNDQLTPSGTMVVNITDRSPEDYTIGSLDGFPFVDKVRIYGQAPAKVMRVPIDAVASMDGFAVADISGYEWPSQGEMARVFATQGQSVVRHHEHAYEFRVNDQAPVTGPMTVVVQFDDGELIGTIDEFENGRPSEGDVIEARLDHTKAENKAWFGEYDTRIMLDEYPAVSGLAEIEVTNSTHPLRGRVVSKPPSIPGTGSVIVAYVQEGREQAVADPIEFDARITIDDEVDQSGRAEVEITTFDGELVGTVQSFLGTPEEGDIVPATVSRGRPPVEGTIEGSNAPVRVQEPVLVSGEIDVEITNTSRPFHAVVDSYRGLLPDVGDKVSATVESGVTLSLAEPIHGQYVVHLSDKSEYEGHAKVRITDISKEIVGEIVETVEPDQTLSDEIKDTPFSSGSPRWNITARKL